MWLNYGKMTQKEIANFFQISSNNFKGKVKEKYLEMLEEFCEYEPVIGKGGRTRYYIIKEIYDRGPYISRKDVRKNAENFLIKEWGKYDEPDHTADSLRAVVNRYCEENAIFWEGPLYLDNADIYVNVDDQNEFILQEKKIHNPDMKEWWSIYGIMTRYIKKIFPKGYRLWLKAEDNFTKCYRISKEESKKIDEISRKYFGPQYVFINDLQEFLDEQRKINKIDDKITFKEMCDSIPSLKHMTNKEKKRQFDSEVKSVLNMTVVRGSDKKEKKK